MLSLLANIYQFFVERNNHSYNNGSKQIHKIDIPVISIGNISAGGTGKTPLTQFITRLLIDNQKRPGIIGRGYKKKVKGEIIVSDGDKIFVDALTAGDEMYMLANNLKVPIISNEIKYLAAKSICEKFEIDSLVVDDGFQHRKLKRDLDIVILDKKTLSHPYLIPKGRLREPIDNYKRADVIAFNFDIRKENKLHPKIKEITKEKEYFTFEKRITGIFEIFSNESVQVAGKKVLAVSGIANNSNFHTSLKSYSINNYTTICYGDHFAYSEKDIRDIINKAKKEKIDTIITTEKDAVKLIAFKEIFQKENLKILYLKMDIFVIENFDLLMGKLLSIFK